MATSSSQPALSTLDRRLTAAVRNGWVDAVRRHLKDGANPNTPRPLSDQGSGTLTPGSLLDLAFTGRRADTLVPLLLQHGADPEACAPSLFEEVLACRNHALFHALLDAGVTLRMDLERPALFHLYRFHAEPLPEDWLSRLVYHGLDLRTPVKGLNALGYVALALDVPAVQYLLRLGADPLNLGDGQTLTQVVRDAPERHDGQGQDPTARATLQQMGMDLEREALSEAMRPERSAAPAVRSVRSGRRKALPEQAMERAAGDVVARRPRLRL